MLLFEHRSAGALPGFRMLVGFALSSLASGAAGAQSVTYATRSAAGVSAHVITVNMGDPRVKLSVVTARQFPGGDEPFTSMVKRAGAVAAINGTFFDKHARIPIGDLVADGRLLHEGRMGTAMAITPANKVLFGRVTWGHSADWSGYETVLACGPTLVKNGRVDLRVSEEGFRDPHVLGAGLRSAAGLTADNRLLLVSVRGGVVLAKLAQVMKALGCVEAMNLDGGASQAMFYRGKVILPAGRRLTNILVVHERARHVALGPTRAVPEGNGSQPLSSGAPRPQGLLAPGGAAAAEPPDWFPVYPGAEPQGEPNGAVAEYLTDDSIEKVVAFYRRELASRARAAVKNFFGHPIGVVKVVSGPGAQSQLRITREPDGRTSIGALFSRPGAPPPPVADIPDTSQLDVAAPSPAEQRFYEEMATCIDEIVRPTEVPAFPGLKRQKLPRGVDLVMYQAPASLDEVLRFYRAELRGRVRVAAEPKRGQMVVLRILSGPGAGIVVQLIANGSSKTAARFFKAE